MNSKNKLFTIIFLFFSLIFFSCSNNSSKYDKFILWTDREEFVSYAEFFNSIQDKTKIVVVYKERLASSLPPARDEETPDLIAGTFLNNENKREFFRPVDFLLSEDSINSSNFYKPLLDYGKSNGTQYLLPVSFNIPLVIFSKKNEKLLTNQYMLSLDEIKESAAAFNQKNKNGFYTNMGFAPSWDEDFVYLVTKEFGPCFFEKGNSFIWDEEKLLNSIEYVKDWTTQKNDSTTVEQDFEFKYLYTPKYRQIAQNRTLFAFISSEEFFRRAEEQSAEIDYRWVSINQKIPVKDDIVTMGIYKHSKNPKKAAEFVEWFFQEENQKLLLERSSVMKLDSQTFGISRGFSSLKNVNIYLFPSYYSNLLGNLPTEQMLSSPQQFPSRWESLQERVIFPFLMEAIKTDSQNEVAFSRLEELLNAWSKQFN